MANTTQYGYFSASTAQNKLGAEWRGRVRHVYGTYEASALAQGEVINITPLYEGEYVLPQSRLDHDALGANSAVAIGITGSPALYAASTATTSAGTIEFDAIDGIGTATASDTTLFATVSGTGALTGTLKFSVLIAWK